MHAPLLILLLACRPEVPDLTAALAEDDPLAIDLTWSSADETTLTLERTLEDGTIRQDALDPAGGSARAHGHPALSVVELRLIAGSEIGDAVSVTIGNLSPSVPTFTLEGEIAAPGELLLLSTSTLDGGDLDDIAVAIDHTGQVVWYHDEPSTDLFRPDLLVVDSGWWSNPGTPPQGDGDDNVLILRSWSGEVLEEIATPAGHHAFAMSPAGLAWPAEESRDLKIGPGVGDVLMVEGEPLMSLWTDLDPDALMSSSNLGNGRFSHTNGMHYDAGDDRFLMTFAAQYAALEVDARTGEPLRWLGEPPPEGIELEAVTWSEDEAMVLPHMAHWTDDGTLLLTGSNDAYTETWATEFAVEGDDLVPVWSFGRGEGLGTPALGSAVRLPGGDTVVNYGTRGVVQRVSADGALVGTLSIGLGRLVGRALIMEPIPLVP